MSKQCTKCKVYKDLEHFSKRAASKDGLNYACKACRKIEKAAWYLKNIETENEKSRDWHKKNKDHSIRNFKGWLNNNPDYMKRYKKNKYDSDDLYRLASNISSLINGALRRNGQVKSTTSQNIIGCKIEDLKKHLEMTFVYNYGIELESWMDVHIDHITPISSATSKEDLIKLNHFSNLQLLFAEDNLKKGSKPQMGHLVYLASKPF